MKLSRLLLLPIGLAAGFTVPNTVKIATPPLYLEKPRPYVPTGFSIENWAAFKGTEEKSREQSRKKRHFQSRPLVDFQKDLEAGKVRYVTKSFVPHYFHLITMLS